MARVHHWLHPQTVPRGFLRLYILTTLSRGPESGYSIMRMIDERTEGAWRPGAGTMYPLLKSLLREGLVRTSREGGRGVSRSYALTPKGRRELEEARRQIAGAGRKEPVMGKLFSDILPGSVIVPAMLRRIKDGSEFFRLKLAEMPEDERTPLLKELRLILASNVDWIDSQLGAARPSSRAKGNTQAKL